MSTQATRGPKPETVERRLSRIVTLQPQPLLQKHG